MDKCAQSGIWTMSARIPHTAKKKKKSRRLTADPTDHMMFV